jgi:16S rRNA processing protein RimM
MKGEPTFFFGTVVGFHGLGGQVKVRPSCNSPEILVGVRNVLTKDRKHFPASRLEIESLSFEKRICRLTFVGYEDRSSVEDLMGAELFTWTDELQELSEEEFWVKDLVGMTVYKENGEEVGRVIGIRYSGNDLLEVRRSDDPPGKTILIPFVKSIVPTVNLSEKRLVIIELAGLLEAQ